MGLSIGKRKGEGKDDGATANGLLIFIEGKSQMIAEKQPINCLLKIDIVDER